MVSIRRAVVLAGCVAIGIIVPPASSEAATIAVPAGGNRLAEAIAASAAGDLLLLAPGEHNAPVQIDHPLTLQGEPGAVIDAHGNGRTIEVTASGVTVRGLTIRGSGIGGRGTDAAIFLEKNASHAVIEKNDIEGNLVGVYVHGAADSIVRGNTIVGRTDLHMNDRGNGVYVWNAPGVQVLDNDISGGRDGIFTIVSRKDIFRGNRLHNVRFAVHYMYTNDSEVSSNTSIGNHAGYVLMYSDRITVRDNVSDKDRTYGFLLNYANMSQISDNAVLNGGQKCVFIYNANKNGIRRNWFEDCRIGIHFTAGSERNALSGNAFVNNQTQVKYVGTRSLDWSENGRGNYWSDNPAFDLNADGIADTAYRPNGIVDQIVWRYPAAKLLLNSPAMQLLHWAQAEFPAIHPGGVIDSAPLMQPPKIPAAHRFDSSQANSAEAGFSR
jgi:nitrous oxidase accessory protein